MSFWTLSVEHPDERHRPAAGDAQDGQEFPAIEGGFRCFVSHWSSEGESRVSSREQLTTHDSGLTTQ